MFSTGFPGAVSPLSHRGVSIPQNAKAWLPPIRLTYSHEYSYENKYNPIVGKRFEYYVHMEVSWAGSPR